MSKCTKGGAPLILGMSENPSSKELVEYDAKRKIRRTLKNKSKRKMRKSQRKRK
jgi:hypothetical protein